MVNDLSQNVLRSYMCTFSVGDLALADCQIYTMMLLQLSSLHTSCEISSTGRGCSLIAMKFLYARSDRFRPEGRGITDVNGTLR